MIDLQQLRDSAGPLWPDIAQAISEAQQPLILERDAAVAKCNAIIAAIADPRASKDDVDAVAKQTERERRIAELTKQRDELQRQIDEASRDTPADIGPAVIAQP